MKKYGIELGSMLFTLVEPHRGHEVEYNRWYERDHFYAGCMIGEWNFAGARFVATRPYKALRDPQGPSPITPDPSTGSFLAIYWILAGHHDEWNTWAVDQVNWLHANNRMFAERDHIHTLLYDLSFSEQRDEDSVSIELALDHRFPGLVVTVAEAASGDRAALERWYREVAIPEAMAGSSPVALVAGFTPLPLLADAPGDVPQLAAADDRLLLLWFLDGDPAASWPATFAGHGAAVAKSGTGTLVWAGPFIPTVVGTDTYTDQLW